MPGHTARTAAEAVTGAAVEALGLRKSYRNVPVLDGLDLRVERGTVFALLGPNGAGKTTTVRVLATLTPPDGGRARVAGYDVVAERARVRRAISLTGQYAAVDDQQTGAENLRMTARLSGLSRRAARHRATALLERFDLAHAADRLVGTYSGGMRRRLDLAAGLVGEPEVVFLDEPTTGLDPRSRQELWEVVRGLAAGGAAVFLTTQYLEEADRLADRVAVMDGGRIVAEGTADALKSRVAGHRLDLVAADAEAYGRLAAGARAVARGAAPAGPGPAASAPAPREPVPSGSPEGLVLGLPTDGTAPQVRALLDALDPDRTDIARFVVRTATLDDVFLALTGAGAGTGTAATATVLGTGAGTGTAAKEPRRV
ncbi:ATP-binding cassette domain-containing protein [Streptomyces somaliensis DSM 40738]|uniref:ABC-type xenobiotic transporter n=1 Tax=Streptomyces somaliensis (strain ATCC 33201 / DSM 40738 / JCM 12659 / KCTC 9044 / NCTC 11332 / NRRL B-12077 / IP 733) TaxID=1134445 RepID=A0AA44DFB9_STRE0|nr:ATP-binding cassette domain-containing protein [Streptomyces somaliensis]MCQ0023350.1 ATP-binding cassette domain-containing protein [Streptomyces somaliensis DSM 40738]NKY15408.1 ATP-binding cassette domain-containing protein [Streptomyces somaliensis DSM 40738]